MNDNELTIEDRVEISKFIQCVNLFRELDPNMRLGTMRSFLTAAMNENITVGELARRTETPVQTMSNYLRTLGEGEDRSGKPAMGLLAARMSPFDGRETMVRMTPKGAELAERIRGVVFG